MSKLRYGECWGVGSNIITHKRLTETCYNHVKTFTDSIILEFGGDYELWARVYSRQRHNYHHIIRVGRHNYGFAGRIPADSPLLAD